MREIGVGARDVRAILLTHGHIDHAGNAAELKDWTGAPIGVYQVRYIQDGTGGRSLTITGVSTSRWGNSTTMPGLNTAAAGETIHNYFYNGTNAYGSSMKVGAV